jgi:hypothetical protein
LVPVLRCSFRQARFCEVPSCVPTAGEQTSGHATGSLLERMLKEMSKSLRCLCGLHSWSSWVYAQDGRANLRTARCNCCGCENTEIQYECSECYGSGVVVVYQADVICETCDCVEILQPSHTTGEWSGFRNYDHQWDGGLGRPREVKCPGCAGSGFIWVRPNLNGPT